MSRPLNYSTKIKAKVTVGECQELLGEAGADAVHVTYRSKQPSGLGFRLNTPHGPRDFLLPVDIDGVAGVLQVMLATNPPASAVGPKGSKRVLDHLASREHAADVAWRVVKDWL